MRDAPKHIDEPLDNVRHGSAICNRRGCTEPRKKQVPSCRGWLFLQFLTESKYAIRDEEWLAQPKLTAGERQRDVRLRG